MTIFLTTMVLIMFLIVPLLKLNEKKHIEKLTNDSIQLEIKEDINIKNSIMYVIIGVIIMFALPFGEHGLYVNVLKILVVVGIYFMEEEMRTRYYLGQKGIYEIRRFKNNAVMNVKRINQNEIFRIATVENKELIYRIYFQKQTQQKAIITDIRIEDKEDLEIFKTNLENSMGLYIEKPDEESPYLKEKRAKEERIFKTLNNLLAKAIVAIVILVTITEIFIAEETTIALMLTKMLAFSYIPTLFYLSMMMFARKQFKLIKKSKKDYFTVSMVGALLLPTATIAVNGVIEAQRFIIVHMISVVTLTIFIAIAFLSSVFVNKIKEGLIIKGMENIFRKAHKKAKTN